MHHSAFARRYRECGCRSRRSQTTRHAHRAHFRDYHLLLDEQSAQILATTDPIAERVRKIGGTTLRSIGQIARLQRAADNDNDTVDAQDMLAELLTDNQRLAENLRSAHSLCDEYRDTASASLIEDWIDEAEQRVSLAVAAMTPNKLSPTADPSRSVLKATSANGTRQLS